MIQAFKSHDQLIPGKFLDSLSASNFLLRTVMIHRRGESEQPCHSSRLPLKKEVDLLLTKGAIHGPLMQEETHLIKEQKPNLNKISNRKECLTLSKALTMSIFIIMLMPLFSRLENSPLHHDYAVHNLTLFA
jgi:hypothetical protein